MNPLTRYRKQNRLSQDAAAHHFKVSLKTIRNYEDGFLATAPPSLAPLGDYRAWLSEQRVKAAPVINQIKPAQEGHPFAPFIAYFGSEHKLALALRVPPRAVGLFMNSTVNYISPTIRRALSGRDINYPHLSELEALMRRYHRGQQY